MSMSSTRTTVDVATHVLGMIYDVVDSPYARACGFFLQTKNYQGLVTMLMPEPEDYSSASAFADDYLCYNVARKFADFETGWNRSEVAIEQFRAAEATCASVNKKLILHEKRGTLTPFQRGIMMMARRKIAKALGPFSWDEAEVHFGFGPGATNGVPRRLSDAYYKFGANPTTTRSNLALATAAVKRVPIWQRILERESDSTRDSFPFAVVAGNKVVTVPKDAKTDRTIAAEPTMNGYIQRGIGAMIRQRLKRVGVNLDDQTLNQELARVGSISGALATIDLHAASDSIAMMLVEELLPSDWLSAIKLCRSPRGILPSGELITYEKVSSMGNTYTFELESLIFWAYSSSVCESLGEGGGRIGIYGDDIVIPVGATRKLIETLGDVGFKVNGNKSFWSGPFRESCGKHYFRGSDVTPFFLRSEPRTLADLISLANAIRLYAARRGTCGHLDSRFKAVYGYVVKLCRAKARKKLPRVPLGFGDAGLVSNFDEATPRWSRRLFAFEVLTYVGKPKDVARGGDARLLRSLYMMEQRAKGRRPTPQVVIDLLPQSKLHLLLLRAEAELGQLGRHNPMEKYDRHRFCTAYVTRWPDIGPWDDFQE